MHNRSKVDPRLIGFFVVGAVILCVAAILFFGPGGFLADTKRYVVFFESSVKGLSIGSPVRFRGVKIGQVREINIKFREQDMGFYIPVVIELELKKIEADGSSKGMFDTLMTTVQGEDPISPLVAAGLRAQLQLDSLVTGQLFINLDMFPEAPAAKFQTHSEYPQIPAVTSSLEELTRTFEDLPLQLLADKLIQTAEGAQRIFTSESLHSGLEQLDPVMSALNQLLASLNQTMPPLVAQLEKALSHSQHTLNRIDQNLELVLKEAQQTLTVAQSTIKSMENQLVPLSEIIGQSMHSVDQAASDVSTTMQHYREFIDGDSPLLRQLSLTLQDLNRTMRSMRYLADEIERDPQILLRGR